MADPRNSSSYSVVPQLQYNTVSGVNGPLVIVENVWHLSSPYPFLYSFISADVAGNGTRTGSYTMLTMDCGTGQIPAIQ